MTWTLTKSELDHETLLLNESLLSLGNGYLGVRGNLKKAIMRRIHLFEEHT